MAHPLVILFVCLVGILSLVHLLVVNVHLSADPATETGGVSPSRMELMRINDTFHRLRNELKRLDAQVAAAAIKPETSITVRKVSIESTEKGVKVPSRDSSKRNSAIIFTMDCIQSYEDQSKRGGAAGELIIRHALQAAFEHFSVPLKIVRSDEEFFGSDLSKFSIILLDPWTWAAPGWVPKRILKGHESKIFIMDFFGAQKLRGKGMDVPPSRFLTAFPTPWNSFLGYYIADDRKQIAAQCGNKSKIQGVVWGKDPKHYDQYQDFLKAIANHVTLVSTVSSRATLPRHPNITWKGHLTQTQWFELLACSKFLLGLGNPLLGPSAIDSVSLGTKFINPSYKEPMLEARYSSQHPYIAKSLPSHVCSYRSGDVQDALRCINEAISETLPPVIPEDFTEMKYLERVKKIFEL